MNNYSNPHLDDLDYQILDILIKDSRTPYLEVARMCHVSGGTIHVRMKKMEELGVIRGTRLIVDHAKLGYDVCAFVGVYLDKKGIGDTLLKELSTIPEIVEIHCITGEYSILMKVICKSIAHLQDLLLTNIHSIENVDSTHTYISLSQPLDRNIGF